ncbi:MAG: TonB family protein, partial [Desulfobacteraceae bacterium]|nr:TonB family protein [Desulfobacteraceae bacterium]
IDIEVIRAQPDKIFNKSVLSCVSQWKFKPGTVEGIPVATRARTTIHFKLED